jgi:glyoxylase-like metal-dependent hydrolase (beta-lactamase superfamily II)
MNRYGCSGYLSPLDGEIYRKYCKNLGPMKDFSELDISTFGDLEIIETPGHSPGSVAFYCEGLLFSGDTLFFRTIGRTDFDGGSSSDILKSLNKLLELPGDTRVIPGHGPFTTIAAERKSNVFVRKINETSWT